MKAFLIALAGLLVLSGGCSIETNNTPQKLIEGKVISIADGDTFTILLNDQKQQKIRLHGIDCPEKKQPFGTVAKKRLSELVFGKTVKVEVKSMDSYKRWVGMVYVDGLNVNEQLLKEGLAWHYKKYDDNTGWNNIELTARNRNIGIWVDHNPTAPWEWRISN